MKKLYIPFLLPLLFLFPQLSFSQDCVFYIPTDPGSVFELTSYNSKGKVSSIVKHEIVEKNSDKENVAATVEMTEYDKKGKEMFSGNYDIFCVDGEMKIDMRSQLRSAQMSSYQNMEMTMESDNLSFPSAPQAGQNLPDAHIAISFGGSGAMMFKMNIEVTERQIEKNEKITTPAGTFDCFKLTQRVKTKMVVKIEATTIDWYAKNVGVVRSESYNKKGKMTGYTELTRLVR